MPETVRLAFKAADSALFDLHRAMEHEMKVLPGEDLWRLVFGMRVQLSTVVKPMVKNNFTAVERTAAAQGDRG